MQTWESLYNITKQEIEESKKPFRDRNRKTFTELFEDRDNDMNIEAGQDQEAIDYDDERDRRDLEESRKTFANLFEKGQKIEEKNTYNQLYEEYQVEHEPLSEQEEIYLVSKLRSDEKLSEAEIQKLEEVGGIFDRFAGMMRYGWGNGKAYADAKKKAYQQQRQGIATQAGNMAGNAQANAKSMKGAAQSLSNQTNNLTKQIVGTINQNKKSYPKNPEMWTQGINPKSIDKNVLSMAYQQAGLNPDGTPNKQAKSQVKKPAKVTNRPGIPLPPGETLPEETMPGDTAGQGNDNSKITQAEQIQDPDDKQKAHNVIQAAEQKKLGSDKDLLAILDELRKKYPNLQDYTGSKL
jgi:hypothetical protein